MKYDNETSLIALRALTVSALFASLVVVAGGASACACEESEPELQEEESASGGRSAGGSIKRRVENLIRIGNVERAQELMRQWPQLFSDTRYYYVDKAGQVRFVDASSAEEAFRLAVDIAPNSGVMRVTGN